MFERFTNRARHVVVLAQEEARLLNHNYIGTEHILLGLLGEPDSIAGQVLVSFGFTRDIGRREVEERIGPGKKAQSGHIPFTPRAKKVLELSLREALSLGHNYIGTEHILLGIIRENDGVAAQVIRDRADPEQLRAAVIEAVPQGSGTGVAEPPEGAEETNAVLRWLRARLSRRGTTLPFSSEPPSAEPPARGTPAVEAALQQAARLAGPLPVGSHHLLLAALEDPKSAASWALASLGVDIDELREKLRAAQVTGTSDEQPEQAGRRQMSIQVTDEILTIVLTDPVIVEAGKEALRAVNARAAAAEAAAAKSASGEAASGEAADGEAADGEAADGESPGEDADGKSSTTTVIRGDNPYAGNLARVWLELRRTLSTLADPAARPRGVKVAVRPRDFPGPAEPAQESKPEEETG
jgi:ATP-dependent Clp protease ATP-binding subunit ClpC